MASAGLFIGVSFLDNTDLFKTECTELLKQTIKRSPNCSLHLSSTVVAGLEWSRMYEAPANMIVSDLYKTPLQTIYNHPEIRQHQQLHPLTEQHSTQNDPVHQEQREILSQWLESSPSLSPLLVSFYFIVRPNTWLPTTQSANHQPKPLVALTALATPSPQSCGGQAIPGSDCGFDDQCRSCHCRNGICA
jgi:hypothetical protein